MPFLANRRGPLTERQRETLLALLYAGAIDEHSARSIYELERSQPIVIGALCDRGYAVKREMRRAPANRCMHYWLTRAGVKLARAFHKLETRNQKPNRKSGRGVAQEANKTKEA